MTNYDVVKKLIGEITPVGESYEDAKRLENLKEMCKLMEEIQYDIAYIAHVFKDDNRGSVKPFSDYANKFLNN